MAVDTAAVRRLWRETGSPSYVAHHFGISWREVMDICVARAPEGLQPSEERC